jgi:hypothetical protein
LLRGLWGWPQIIRGPLFSSLGNPPQDKRHSQY